MTTPKPDTVSLLSHRCIDFLDLIAPQWQFLQLKRPTTADLESLQVLVNLNLSTLGDLSAVTPLMLLALGAKIAGPPAEGTLFWEYLVQQECEAIKPLLQTIFIDRINTALSQFQEPAPHQPTEGTIDAKGGETSYSSLLIQPEEVINQWTNTDSITIVNWPHAIKRPVAFVAGEICATPLLASPVRDALRAAGYDLRAVPLSVLSLSVRTANRFRYAHITTLEALTSQPPNELMTLRNFGPRALEETLRAARDYLLPRLEAVPAETLVPAARLHPFVAEQSSSPFVPEPALSPTGEQQATPTAAEADSGYSSLFLKIEKVLQQTRHPYASTISLFTPIGKGRAVHFAKGEVGNTPLLAKHIREALRAIGCNLNLIGLDRLQLSPRTRRLLELEGITRLELLLRLTPNTLMKLPGFNVGRYQETVNILIEYLTPWLRKLPLEMLVPQERRQPTLFAPVEDVKASAGSLQAQNHQPLRRGKNALFFPIDAVLQAMGLHSNQEDVPLFNLPEEEAHQNTLLSDTLMAALARQGCYLASTNLEQLFLSGISTSTLSIRTYNALRRAGMRTLGELARQTPSDLMNIRNFGVGSYREVIEALFAYLQPWIDALGIDLADEENLLAYQDPAPLEFDAPAEPELEETAALSDLFAALIPPDLLAWLDYYEIPWQQLSIAEACPTLKADAGLAPLSSLTLGNLATPEQLTIPEPLIAPELAEQALTEIQQTLVAMLARQIIEAAPSAQEQEHNRQIFAPISIESLLAELLNQYILTNRKSSGQSANDLPREMIVLLAHSGVLLGQTKTLEELAATFHLTREGVRQLELRAEAALHRGAARPFIEGLSVLVKWTIQAEGGVTTVSRAADRVATWLPFGDLDPPATIRLLVKWATNTTVKGDARLVSSNTAPKLLDEIDGHLERIFRTQPDSVPFDRLVDKVMRAGGDAFLKAGRDFVAAGIRISDVIEIQDGFCLPRGRGSLRAQLVSVLRALGRPAHFNEVAERYNALFPEEKPRTGHTVQAIFLRFPETFARIGNGTYALAEAGYEGALTVADALERILQENDQPMHANDILAQGRERYQWKESALQAGLRTNAKLVSLGYGFFALADRSYPEFDAAKSYETLFGAIPTTKERLVVATYTNQQQHVVIQLKLSVTTVRGSIPLTSKAVRDLFPLEGDFQAEALSPGKSTKLLTLNRRQHDISGLRVWFKQIYAQPNNFLFLEKMEGDTYTYRLAYAPLDKLTEAMQMVSLSPADEVGGALDYRVLWRTREPEKLGGLLTYTLEHPWTTLPAANAALGFALGRPEGSEYVEIGLLGGLLALGKIAGAVSSDIVRATPFGRAWITQQHNADTLPVSLALSLPPYRAHLRSGFHDEQTDDDTDVEQMTTALLDPKLLTAWDARFGLAASPLRDRVLRESNAVVTTARLPSPVLILLLLLLAAQSNGLGIALTAAEASGLAGAQDVATRLRQLGIAVQWDSAGHAGLAEQVHLAVTSSASVEQRLRAQSALVGAALAECWHALQQNAWPLTHLNASDLYTELMGTHGALFNSLLVPTPEGVDQTARYIDGRCVPCPFVSLAADWGLVPTEQAPAPFAFLSHTIRLTSGQGVDPIAICLNRELLAQDWDVKRALAANAHLALLTLIASDVGGLAERCTLGEQGYLLAGRPLVQALDELLRGLGYTVWDEGYCQNITMQAALGQELVALAGKLGLLAISTSGFEALSPLATEVYYSAYDVLLHLQALSSQLVNDHRLG